MKKYSITKFRKIGFALLGLLFVPGCQNEVSDLRDIDATVSQNTNPDVFIDTFSGGLDYAAFGGSDYKGFQVDSDVTYNGSSASMRFDVPNVGDPDGAYTGGCFFSTGGRNLSGYNVLTFWAKALQASTIEIGFGLDNKGSQDYKASCTQKISTTWKKYYLPIPDASKLKLEKGLLYVSAGPKNTDGFTFWLDEVKYEKLDDVILQEALINSGKNTKIIGPAPVTIEGLTTKFGLPNGGNIVVNTASKYFHFLSDKEEVSSVVNGVVRQLSPGTATITATLRDQDAVGSIEITNKGPYIHAPTPTRAASNVISVFSDTYTNVNAGYNLFWQPYQTTTSADFIVDGDNVLSYLNFNFVSNGFFPPINVTKYPNLHLNMYIPAEVPAGLGFEVELKDFGPNGIDGGGDDSLQTMRYNTNDFKANTWVTLDFPLTMSNRSNIGFIIYRTINGSSKLESFYLDNIYFYDNGIAGPKPAPDDAPEKPTEDVVTNKVISIFSDAYTDVPNSGLNATPLGATLSTVNIANNNVLKYLNLNFIEQKFSTTIDASGTNMLHIDVWSPVDNDMEIKIVDVGASGFAQSEGAFVLTGLKQNEWKSFDIPLSNFNNPTVRHIGKIIIDNGYSKPNFTGTLFIDNMYFYKK
jgi:hypothetical protein